MKKTNQRLLILCLLLIVIASCKFSPNNINIPNWESNILGPLVRTNATGNNIIQMKTLSGTASVTLKALGNSIPGTGTIPPVSGLNLPPFHLQMFNAFKSLTIESGMLYFTLTNHMPVTLKAGTRIAIIDSISHDTLMSVLLLNDVSADTGFYSIPNGIDMAGKTIESSLSMLITNLSTDSSAGPVTISGNESFTVSAYIKNASFLSCTVGNDSAVFRDTTNFNLQGAKVKTLVTGGTITTFLTNGLPFDMNLQFYFMGPDKTYIIDSLFDNVTTIPARLGASFPSTDSLVCIISDSKLTNLNNARYVISSLQVRNISGLITLSKSDSIQLLLVGNLKVQLN